jgi:type I restriction enzyme M protein
MGNSQQAIGIIWPIAELLRGDYRRSEYGKVILPFTVLRRLDCVLAPTKAIVLKAAPDAIKKGDKIAERLLNSRARQAFHNRSPYDFAVLANDQAHITANLQHYLNGFSANIREVFEYFLFADQILRLEKANLLYKVVQRFGKVDLRPADVNHPDGVDNHDMGAVFEELIRRFSEQSNETAGEHFTPREVIKLMVNLLFMEDREALRSAGIVRTLYDPACGTGGMLSVAEEYLHQLNPEGRLELFGQEINPEAYAICKSDMIIKGNNAANIKFGNSFTTDGLKDETFDYMLSNPPFGVEWKKVEETIRDEHDSQGYAGRFGAGLPRVSDGSLLFLQHMLAKRSDGSNGTRVGIIFNGSPLFAGGAGSGESEIRRWIIEKDWLEAVVALPDQLFYNTGISTYLWIITNRKSKARQGKVQLINANGENFFVRKKKSLGNKRNEIGDGEEGRPDQIANITILYGQFGQADTRFSRVFANADFGYRRITVERPLRMNFRRSTERIVRIDGLRLPTEVKERAIAALSQNLDDSAPGPLFKNLSAFWEAVRGLWPEGEFPNSKQANLLMLALGDRDETADPITDEHGIPVADPQLRDFENVPLTEAIDLYFAREVLPYVPDAWINEDVCDEKDGAIGIVGYDIPFTRHFYEFEVLPLLADIEAQLVVREERIEGMLKRVLGQ